MQARRPNSLHPQSSARWTPRAMVAASATLATLMVLAGCGSGSSSKSAGTASESTVAVAPASADTSAAGAQGADTTASSAFASGKVDCQALTAAAGSLIVNWQLVIGMGRTPVNSWADTIKTIGTFPQFGDQLATLHHGLDSDADAKAALDFMSGAVAIAQKGLDGDATADAALKKYLGDDVGASVSKQAPIAMGIAKVGC